MKTAIALIASTLLVASSTSALAAPKAQSYFQTVQVTLTDLNVNDGIAPSLSFTGSSGSLIAPNAWDVVHIGNYHFESPFASWTDPTYMYYNPGMSTADGWTSGELSVMDRVEATSATLSMMASASAITRAHPDGTYYFIGADVGWTGFTLSANTAVQFSVVNTIELTTGPTGPGNQAEFASASQWLSADVNGEYVRDDGYTFAGLAFGGPQTVSKDIGLSIYLANNAADSVSGSFAYGGTVGAQALAPVPEPGTWAMLGLGLAVVGGVARRRSARTTRQA